MELIIDSGGYVELGEVGGGALTLRSNADPSGYWYGIRTANPNAIHFDNTGPIKLMHARGAIAIEATDPSMPDLATLRNEAQFLDNVSDVSFDRDLFVDDHETLRIDGGWKIGFTAQSDAGAAGKDDARAELIIDGELLAGVYDTIYGRVEFVSDDPNPNPADWYGIRFFSNFQLDSVYIACPSIINYAEIRNARYGVAIEHHCGPTLKDILFDDADSIHVLLDSADVAIPYEGEWTLQGPTRVVARNAAKAEWDFGYGEKGLVDLMVHGKLNTTGSEDSMVWFRPEVPNDATASDWGGVFLDWPSAGSEVRHAEFSHAPFPLMLYYPDSTTTIDSCEVHHFVDSGIWIAKGLGDGAKVLSSLIERGENLDPASGKVGIQCEDTGQLILKANRIDLSEAQASGAGIWMKNTPSYCGSVPGTSTVEIDSNRVIGPGNSVEDFSGIDLERSCGDEPVTIVHNNVTDWGVAGLLLDQSHGVQISCNTIATNDRNVDFSNDGSLDTTSVLMKDNTLEDHSDVALWTDNASILKLGPASANTGNNVIKTSGVLPFVSENDEDSTAVLNAKLTQWYLASGEIAEDPDSVAAHIVTDLGTTDPARVDFNPLGEEGDPGCTVPAIVLAGKGEGVIEPRGSGRSSGTEDPGSVRTVLPTRTELGAGRPTPFRGETRLSFAIAPKDAGAVRVTVYDVTGRRIRVLFASDLLAGFYEVRWDGRDVVGRRVASGVYFARLESSGTTSVRKLVKLN